MARPTCRTWNTLDYERWGRQRVDTEAWRDMYGDGWKAAQAARHQKTRTATSSSGRAIGEPAVCHGDIVETRILAKYDLARSVSFDKIGNVDADDKETSSMPAIRRPACRSPYMPAMR